jgi:hypothetical protein
LNRLTECGNEVRRFEFPTVAPTICYLTAMKAKGLALPQGNGSDHVWMAGPALK